MDDLDRQLLTALNQAEEAYSLQTFRKPGDEEEAFNSIIAKTAPGWKVCFFINPSITDDNVIVKFYRDDNYDTRWFHIHTSDDSFYNRLDFSQGLYSHDL